jgi:hypothetical protein
MTMETKVNPWDALTTEAPRTPRSLETRENTSRSSGWDDSILPEVEPRNGWSHKWVRTDTMGVADKMTYSKRLRQGWEPVDIADYPELAMYVDHKSHGKVEVGGLILCRIPEERVKQRSAHYLNKARVAESSAEEHYMRDQNELIKKVNENSRKVVFGQNAR